MRADYPGQKVRVDVKFVPNYCVANGQKYYQYTAFDECTGFCFEQELVDMDIIYHRIRVATPRHNGKVERQHRLDEERFYYKMRMYSLDDGRRQHARYNKVSNNISKSRLKFHSPNAVLAGYLAVMLAAAKRQILVAPLLKFGILLLFPH